MKNALMAASAIAGCFIGGTCFAQNPPKGPVQNVQFNLKPNATVVQCLSADGSAPTALVTVKRGDLADTLKIEVHGLKPNLDFDLFTVQRSSLDSAGKAVPATDFKGFGLAWYQTDLHADPYGDAVADIKTILLDQIFGFDADKRDDGSTVLPPTNTFHVGFWFNNPADAQNCGFDVTKPTPFNGEHKAGPLAMISLPDAKTGLGPLCTSPTGNDPDDTSKLACNP